MFVRNAAQPVRFRGRGIHTLLQAPQQAPQPQRLQFFYFRLAIPFDWSLFITPSCIFLPPQRQTLHRQREGRDLSSESGREATVRLSCHVPVHVRSHLVSLALTVYLA